MKLFVQPHAFSLSKVDRNSMVETIRLTLSRFSSLIDNVNLHIFKTDQDDSNAHRYHVLLVIGTSINNDIKIDSTSDCLINAIHFVLKRAKRYLSRPNFDYSYLSSTRHLV